MYVTHNSVHSSTYVYTFCFLDFSLIPLCLPAILSWYFQYIFVSVYHTYINRYNRKQISWTQCL